MSFSTCPATLKGSLSTALDKSRRQAGGHRHRLADRREAEALCNSSPRPTPSRSHREPDTFLRGYVEALRHKAAEQRFKAKRAAELGRLGLALVAANVV